MAFYLNSRMNNKIVYVILIDLNAFKRFIVCLCFVKLATQEEEGRNWLIKPIVRLACVCLWVPMIYSGELNEMIKTSVIKL